MRPRHRIYQTTLWKRTRLAILERDHHRCRLNLNGCTLDATTVDHVVPLNAGGRPYDPSNLVAACRHCNTAKSDRPANTLFKPEGAGLPALGNRSRSLGGPRWGAIRQ